MTTAIVRMGEGEARTLTDRIKRGVENISMMVADMHDREGWRALGYDSWTAYVAAEFTVGWRQSYALVDQGRAMKMLAEVTGGPVEVSKRAAQKLVRDPARVAAAAKLVAAGVPVAEAVKRVALPPLKQKRAKKGPPSLTGWLADFRKDVERMENALENAGDDALSYLDSQTRRDLERTADKCYEFWSGIIKKLSAPIEVRVVDEYASA